MQLGLDDILISFAIFMACVIGGVGMISAFHSADPDTYPNTVEYTSFNSTFAKLDSMQSKSQAQMNAITNSTSESGTFGVVGGVINIMWTQLKQIPTTFGLMFDIILSTSAYGVPGWVIALVTTILVTTLVFALIYVFTLARWM